MTVKENAGTMDKMSDISTIVFAIAILVMSVVVHEVSHGFMALMLGDQTAKYSGRLTLNPLAHLDPFGSVLLPAMLALFHLPIFGWARPVPYNPYNLRNQKWGPGLVAAAGPISNLFIALIFGVALRFSVPSVNAYVHSLSPMFVAIVYINIVLAIFNLVPIPPLDGSKVLFSILPYHLHLVQRFLEAYGILLLILFVYTALPVIQPVINAIFYLMTGALLK